MAYVQELMADWGVVSARKMFGGYGLYRDGLMFALIAEDELYFKVDRDNMAEFETMHSHPFVYQSKARTVKMSYWCAPCACLETPADMHKWCLSAYAAALRTSAQKSSRYPEQTK